MRSFVNYLISGAVTPTTGSVQILGMDKFTVTMHGASFGADVATGTLTLNARVENSAPYINLHTINYAGNSGVAIQFDGPWSTIQAVVSPLTTGTYTVVARYCAEKG